MKRRILCVPETRQGHGTGHIKRCLELVTAIGDQHSGLYLPTVGTRTAHLVPAHLRIQQPEGRYDAVVIDMRSIDRRIVERFAGHGMVIGLDANGSGRRWCDYVIDMLPQIRQDQPANIYEPGFLSQPRNLRTAPPQSLDRILLTFGGEDALGLSAKLAAMLVHDAGVAPERITVLIGGSFHAQEFPEGVQQLRNISNARDIFAEYDLVISQFGLSMFEAAAAGCAVAGVHPSRYHRKLADIAGFFSLGVRTPALGRVRALLENQAEYLPHLLAYQPGKPQSLAEHISSITPQYPLGSPVAGPRCNPAVLRLPDETFFRCGKTRLLFKQRFRPVPVQYDRNYFGEEYRRQYGRTYEEDFGKIQQMGERRMQYINRLHSQRGALLDLGCALGPFLMAARNQGWQAYGVDISEDAVAYIREQLGIPAVSTDMHQFSPRRDFDVAYFQAITLWFVIEHIPDLGVLLQRLNRMLDSGGVLALSTPNGSGISARKNRSRFLSEGPVDHLTVLEPRNMQQLFGDYGFRVEKIHVTGHHPERFPGLGRWYIGRIVAAGISKLLGLGDTFEVYLRKAGEPPL